MRKSIPKKVREAVIAKFNGHCAYCGEKPERLQIDHVVPVVRMHGTPERANDLNNLLPACFSCNNYKMNLSLEQFRRELSEQVWRARRHSLNFRLAERFGLIQETPKPIVFYFEKDRP